MTAQAGLLGLVLALALPSSARADVERYQGTAYDEDGKVVYQERHEVVESGGRLERALTTYLDPRGKTIGRLQSDFSQSEVAPDYWFLDLRSGKRESARNEGGTIVLGDGGREARHSVPRGETIVLGQGMHHFARLNLDLLAKRTLKVRFGIPSRLDTYGFRVRPVGAPAPGVVRLRIESDSWFIRRVAPHIEVDYELSSRRLLRYHGPSNLEDADGDTQEVVIVYRYGEQT